MTLFKNGKIETLKSYISNNKMKEYKDLSEDIKISESEAIKLYENAEYTDKLKSVYYFLMPEEYKMKYIDDIKNFNSIFNQWRYFSELKIISDHVFEALSIIGTLDQYHIPRIFRFIEDENIKGKIMTNIIKSKNIDTTDVSMYDVMSLVQKIPTSYQKDICHYMINNMQSYMSDYRGAAEFVDILSIVNDYNIQKELIKEYITNIVPKIEKKYDLNYTLKHLIELMKEYDLEEIIRFIKETTQVDNTTIASVLPLNKIVDFYKKNDDVDLKEVLKDLNYDNLKKNTSEFFNILKTYIVDKKEDSPLDRCNVIYFYSEEEKRCECVDLMFEKYGFEDYKEYIAEMFDDVDEFDLNKYPNIKNAVIEVYGIKNIENLEKFLNRFNFSFKYFSSQNIVDLINSDSELYDEIVSLFSEQNTVLNENVANTVVNSFLQRQFRIERDADYNIYSRFESLFIEKNDYTIKEVKKLFEKMQNVIDLRTIADFDKLTIDSLFSGNKESLNILHNITNAYISKWRELYVLRNKNLAYNSLDIQKYYTKSYIKKAFIVNNNDIFYISGQITDSKFKDWNEEEKDFIEAITFIDDLLEIQSFKRGEIRSPSQSLMKKVKILDGILDKLYESKELFLKEEREDAKYQYIFEEMDNKSLLNILSGVMPEAYSKNIKGKGLFKSLNNLLSKYKMIGWKETFKVLGESCNLNFDESTVYCFINYFDKIYNKFSQLEEKNRTLTALLDIANVYGCPSSKYEMLIDKENFEYICLDPNPNKTSSTKNQRLALVADFAKKMYGRDSITVPSGENTITLSNNKDIKFSIGDIYNPIALTYGERTASCLRINGAFSDLFSYCLEDKNGFHIRFNDPLTGEFISRVSGFRNGNTVFLNELRETVLDHYSNEELVETLQKIAEFLVKATKDSPHPIENVVISNDYSMSDQPKCDLNLTDRKEAFNGLHFNIAKEGNILYTSSEDHKTLVPYKFGDEYTCEYKPYNSFVGLGGPKEANEIINRVYMIDELLKDKDFGDLEIIENVDAQKCIYGYGWVVYIDSSGKLHEKIIEKFKKDKELRTLIEESKKKYFGGQNNEKDWKDSRI